MNKKYQIIRTKFFKKWLNKQSNEVMARVNARLRRVSEGNLGDYKFFGEIGELRLDFGRGYRIYFAIRGEELILLLLGGDKNSQDEDFKKARKILKTIEN